MQRFLAWAMLGCVLATVAAPAVQAASPIIGVNGDGANIDDMAANRVKTLRIGLSPDSIDFIIDAYRHGIASMVVVHPFTGTSLKWEGPSGAAHLSRLHPQEFVAGVTPLLDKLEAAGVRLAAIELGSEPNGRDFNGDIPSAGSGRVLGLADLNNPNDAETRPIAAGFRVYVKIMAALKDIRDHSKLNQQTPLITAGMANWGPPRKAFYNGRVAVSLTDTIEFLRQNGIDEYADGYGAHYYLDLNLRMAMVARIAQLEQVPFAACTRAKPCWLTEWGWFDNADQSCPAKDNGRQQAIGTWREAFKHFVDEGRLSALIFNAWVGAPGKKVGGWGIWRCGSVTEAGKLALSPM